VTCGLFRRLMRLVLDGKLAQRQLSELMRRSPIASAQT